jgi:photosystem II stability/assembly factor-like uncharacterized protein
MNRMKLKQVLPLLLWCLTSTVFAQKKKDEVLLPQPTPATGRIEGFKKVEESNRESIFYNIPVRSVGPTVMSGRVVDLEVDPQNPIHFYVAFASGGLWVTHNNGASFEPLFQDEIVMTIGDIAVDWEHGETIWLGSGENNSSRSSYSGCGIFKSTDLGKSWQPCGLTDSHHIGRIVIHPNDPSTVYLAALGHLYSSGDERGVYKTSDSGKTWVRSYETKSGVGAIDLVMDPLDPDHLFFASWEKSRSAWNFKESGASSGVYESKDAGKTWSLITGADSGFPMGDGVGRIGLDLYSSNGEKVLYVMLDNQFERPETEEVKKDTGLKKKDFESMKQQEFLSLSDSLLENFLRNNNFPERHTAISVKAMVRNGEIKPSAISDYLYDANDDLFSRPVIGAEVYAYDFSTKKWKRTHENFLDDVVYSYGYYFSQIRVHPENKNKLYIAGVPLLTSDDGGANWRQINPENVHGDHHALWINTELDGHIINGSDGGVQISYDDGKTFVNCNTPAVGQFYSVQVDNADPYNVYGGLQDNGVWVGPSTNKSDREWYQSGRYPYEFLMGGDGMQVEVDTRNNSTIYTGFQFGYYSRLSRSAGQERDIHPEHVLGETPLRWNWETPILLSKHQQDIFYICSNKVHRSLDKGETFETLSGDLTKGPVKGDVPYGTLTSMAESPLRFGWLMVGSDDGLVHLSVDNGYTWNNISTGLPANFWVSKVGFSSHKKERIYVSLNGYRFDHFEALIYQSEDLGKTWKLISGDLPKEPVNVVIEDPSSPNILYCGTDHGLYVSPDMGKSWDVMAAELPRVAVHDLVIQDRERDLVIGTHGRSIWIADIENMGALDSLKNTDAALFELKKVRRRNWGNSWNAWSDPAQPDFSFPCFLPANTQGCRIQIFYKDSLLVKELDLSSFRNGFNYVPCDFTVSESVATDLAKSMNQNRAKEDKEIVIEKSQDGKYYLPKGTYTVILKAQKDYRNVLIIE